MKKIFIFILSISFLFTQAQIGGGWDWAYNTGSYSHDVKYIGYSANGDMLIVARTNSARYLGTTNTTVPDQADNDQGERREGTTFIIQLPV